MENWERPKVYAVKHKDLATRMASRSGGIFTALTDHVLANHGSIYGCVLVDNRRAVHIRAVEAKDRDRMRGSKYIQSEIGESFSLARSDLQSGRMVLFSGTSCQIAGLRAFLGKPYENLICVDIVCHGVPSPLVWQNYVSWQEQKSGGKCIAADFRNKADYGWHDHVESLTMELPSDQKVVVDSRVFTTMFFDHAILRPSCYHCPYKSVIHPGDITIADYWGVETAAPDFSDNKGVSLVLVNNTAGQALFDLVSSSMDWVQTRLEDSMQPSLVAPFPEPAHRKRFWQDFARLSFDSIAKKYGGLGVVYKARNLLGRVKRKVKKLLCKV